MVFLHGVGGLTWDPLLDAIAADHRVIAPEHPGAGTSQGLDYVETLWDLVLYYDELLDVLGLPAVSLVGHSFGGMVAAEIAATSPERVDRLVLIAPLGLWRDDHPVPDISGVPRASVADLLPAADPGDPESLLRASMTMASILQFIWPLPDKGLRKRLYRVHAETLVVWGEDDRIVHPAYGDDFVAAIANARLELVPAAGHLPHLEQPDRTADAGDRVPPVLTTMGIAQRSSSDKEPRVSVRRCGPTP